MLHHDVHILSVVNSFGDMAFKVLLRLPLLSHIHWRMLLLHREDLIIEQVLRRGSKELQVLVRWLVRHFPALLL